MHIANKHTYVPVVVFGLCTQCTPPPLHADIEIIGERMCSGNLELRFGCSVYHLLYACTWHNSQEKSQKLIDIDRYTKHMGI